MKLLPPPDLTKTTKNEIRNYFLNTFEFFESIFDVLKPQAFYVKSEPTRHPMIFYYGHTAVFYINKLYTQNLIQERIYPSFESIFAVGVDEMEWDNLDENAFEWPSIEAVREYREKVKQKVLDFIEQTPLEIPITWENPYWIVLIGCEHERIHIETSSVLHRQMPLKFIKPHERFAPNTGDTRAFLKNELLTLPATTVTLGKNQGHFYYGWDNEYGKLTQKLQPFTVSKFLVNNGEFLEFVQEGGYEEKSYWDEEGKAFLQRSGAKHPHLWRKTDDGWLYRAYDREVSLPLDFPVDVNALEAEAFCRWKSKKEKKNYRLISETEYKALYEHCNLGELIDQKSQNVNFAYGFSSTPVTKFETNGFFDVCGNAWCWSRTPIDGFEGFRVHPAYDDFSTPTFDGKHNIIVGASWASSGNLIMKHSRYAFRKHFFQHASFRYVISENETQEIAGDLEKDPQIIAILEEDYIRQKHLKFVHFALRYARRKNKALDMGCLTGRSAFELAKTFQNVEALDATARLLKVGVALKNRNYLKYIKNAKQHLLEFNTSALAKKVHFSQADENNLKPHYGGYDFVLYRGSAQNFLDKLNDITNDEAVVVCQKDFEHIEGFKKIAPGVFEKL